MGYSNEILHQALDIVRERGRTAEAEAERRRRALEKKHPEFVRIQAEISESGMKAAKAIFAGAGKAKELLGALMEENLRNQQKIKALLAKEHLPEDYLSPPFHCSLCSDSGYQGNHMCDCAMELAKKLAFEQLNEKSPLSLCSFGDFRLSFYSDEKDEIRGLSPRKRMSEIFDLTRAYAENFSADSENLLFIGSSGLGKTHLSLAIASEVIQKGYGAVYGSSQDLLHKIEREHFSRGDKGENDTLNLLLECDLLIFDDFGTEFGSPFIQSTVYNLLNSRMLRRKPTIISTNLSLSEIRAGYHERIVSRLVGAYVILEFIGKDVRFLKKQRKS